MDGMDRGEWTTPSPRQAHHKLAVALSALLLSMRSHSVILVILYRHDLTVLYPDPAFPDQICEKRIQNGISHTHMPSQSAPLHLSASFR